MDLGRQQTCTLLLLHVQTYKKSIEEKNDGDLTRMRKFSDKVKTITKKVAFLTLEY